MAPLPAFRLETAPPFYHTGCDFAGPIKYKNDSGEKAKSYILLFVCAVTRAVHLELTTDMSTSEVLGALQKFVNRYPSVTTITSDNGLSFQRTAKELKLLYDHIINGEIKKWLADKFIRWNFITPNSPSHGGFYERLVQSVKRPLRKVLGTSVPHFRDLEVILSNIELMINKRPITAVASGLDSTEALSPMDLLHGYRGDTFFPQHAANPMRTKDSDKIIFSRRWTYQQRILNSFWKRFHREYLSYLRSAHNRLPIPARPLKIGDICLLEDSNANRAYWPLCKVIALKNESAPEKSKSCTIKTATGQIFNRPITKLFPIEHSQPN
ncbi:uncharacterized protein LOC100898400 [Galendromus occidentalis]|nr:uncharacterized protein LOC100899669 [Galendromus occidentalis]XP_003738289.1 uncharacterized protein LOC100898102 [Galendromus occidentalis]XP_003740081.1 uncharacterized protein LOC100898400 [Galendromus occidentalis]